MDRPEPLLLGRFSAAREIKRQLTEAALCIFPKQFSVLLLDRSGRRRLFRAASRRAFCHAVHDGIDEGIGAGDMVRISSWTGRSSCAVFIVVIGATDGIQFIIGQD
jgi:hypothetical protein